MSPGRNAHILTETDIWKKASRSPTNIQSSVKRRPIYTPGCVMWQNRMLPIITTVNTASVAVQGPLGTFIQLFEPTVRFFIAQWDLNSSECSHYNKLSCFVASLAWGIDGLQKYCYPKTATSWDPLMSLWHDLHFLIPHTQLEACFILSESSQQTLTLCFYLFAGFKCSFLNVISTNLFL